MPKLTPQHAPYTHEELKLLWLNSRGGRKLADVLVDEGGEYVLMLSGRVDGLYMHDEKVYLPSEETLRVMFKLK